MTSPRESDLHREHLVTILTDLLLRALQRPGAEGSNGREDNDRITARPAGPTPHEGGEMKKASS